jgi:hypothetical protein
MLAAQVGRKIRGREMELVVEKAHGRLARPFSREV